MRDMTPQQESTYRSLRGDYDYAEVLTLTGTNDVEVDFYTRPDDDPARLTFEITVRIGPDGDLR